MERLRLVLLAVSTLMLLLLSLAPSARASKGKLLKPVSPRVHAALVGEVSTAPALARVAKRPDPQRRVAKKHAHEPEPEPPPAPPAAPSTTVKGTVWDRLAQCESGGRWNYNGGSGFDGGLQFHPSTWSAYAPAGYPAYAYQASREQQIAVAERVLASQGWGAWPACSSKLGLR